MTIAEMPPRETTRKPAVARPRKSSRNRLLLLVLGGIVIVAAIVAILTGAGAGNSAPVATPAATAVAPSLAARGVVEPVSQATIATISGGVVRSLGVRVGQPVEEGQRIAEIATSGQTEILVAPWRGTVMGIDVNRGDTVIPGATVAAIGDLSRYQVRTTDVDEYLIGQIMPGQMVNMTVDALDGRKLQGTVDTVALIQQTSSAGATNYPVIIQLSRNDPDLRPGMTARIVFTPIN